MGMTNIGIYGPGSSSSSPVYKEVTCNESSTNVCFIVSGKTKVDNCYTETVFNDVCTFVNIAPDCTCNNDGYSYITGNTTVTVEETTLTVYYKIKQIKEICPPTPPTPTEMCEIGDYWITKSGDTLFVEYEKIRTIDYGDYADVTKTLETSSVACSSSVTIDTGCGNLSFNYDCEGGAEECSGTSYHIRNISFDPPYVENSGGSISATVIYEEIIKNSDCSSRKKTKRLTKGSITIPGCDSGVTNCCYDRYINLSLLSLTESLTGGTLYYNGRKVTTDISIPYLEKSDDCSRDRCNYKTTYCVNSGTVKTLYETYYMSGVWVTVGSVPESGGRIKVIWDYEKTETPTVGEGCVLSSSHEKAADGKYYLSGSGESIGFYPDFLSDICSARTYSGSDYTIINVPACKQDFPTTAVTGEILYKEQTDGCITCSAQTYDGVRMNAFTYKAKQDCKCTAGSAITEIIKAEVYDLSKCRRTVSVTPSATVTTYKENCTHTSSTVELEEMVFIIGENQTESARTIENEYAIIHQDAGPCYKRDCECDTFKFLSSDNSECESLEYKFLTAYIDCDYTERVKIIYFIYCGGVSKESGSFYWTDTHGFMCDKDSTTGTTHTYTFPTGMGKPWDGQTITVIQCSGGTCDCGCG